MRNPNCLKEQDLTLLYYDENPDSMDLLAAHRHLKNCPACRQRQQQLAHELQALPTSDLTLDPHYATRLAARVVERAPQRRLAFPAIAGGLAAAAVVFTFSFWKPETQTATVTYNTATNPTTVTENTLSPETDLLENLDLLREFDTLSELTGV